MLRRTTPVATIASLAFLFIALLASSSTVLGASSSSAADDIVPLEGLTPDAVTTPATATTAPSHASPPLVLTQERALLLVEQGIVPRYFPTAPSTITKLSWGPNLRINDFNSVLKPSQISDRPRLNYNIHANRYYAIALVDIDAPSATAPSNAQWLHWLIVNVPGRDISRGDTLVQYVGAAPPEGSGFHRYICVVYEQSQKMLDSGDVTANTDASADADSSSSSATSTSSISSPPLPHISATQIQGRSYWHIDRWMSQRDPSAKLNSINWFRAEWDDFVPEIYKQFEQSSGSSTSTNSSEDKEEELRRK